MAFVRWLVAGLLLSIGIAQAQVGNYPSRVVTSIVPCTAGGPTDLGTRALADGLTKLWKRRVVVDNRPGGGTMIGINMVAKAAPDGYMLGTFTNSFLTNPAVRSNVPYDTFKDLVGVSMILESPTAIAVNAKLPIHSLAELIAAVKQHTGPPMTFATPGLASGGHMSGELLKRRTGIKLTHIPYNGTSEALTDVVAGRVDIMISTWSDIKPFVQSQQLTPLAVFGNKRLPDAPDVPTAAETLPDFSATGYSGIVAPAGIPHDLLEKISADIQTVVKSPEYLARIRNLSNIPWATTPSATQAFMQDEYEKWAKIANEQGIRLN